MNPDAKQHARTSADDFNDGTLSLEIGQHAMRAHLELLPGFSGHLSHILDFLKAHNVVYGVDQPGVNAAIEQLQRTGKPVKLTIACGKAPVDAVDGRVDFKFAPPDDGHHEADTDKNIDFRELNKIVPVKKDQLLAVQIPAKDSVMGTDVHGKAVLAEKRRGISPNMKAGRNVRVVGEEFYADCDGLVQITGREIQVVEEYRVNGDVDFSVGNIRFAGNVVVSGNVRPGFTIDVGGDVKVMGEVNDARIKAAGSITVNHGIIGTGKTEIVAGLDIFAGFIENSRVETRGSLRIRSHAMHSMLFADNMIQATSGKGALIGGEARAGKGIQTRIIGSESVPGTVAALGGGIEQDNQLREIRRQLATAGDNMLKIERSIGEVAFKRLMSDPKQLRQMIIETRRPILQKLADNYRQLQAAVKQLETRRDELEQRIAAAQKGIIQASGMAYQGAIIAIAHLTMELKADRPAVTFYGDFEAKEIKTR